jgi:hypothetical protein
MLNIRDNFIVRPDKVRQAVDAGVSDLFKEILPLLEQTPIDKNQQSLLDEVKMLADSLKNTILDTSEEQTGSKDDEKIGQFIVKVIDKEVNTEKQKPQRPKDQDKKLDQILPGKQESVPSPNKTGKIKGAHPKNKVQRSKMGPIYDNSIEVNPIVHAEHKKFHQPEGLKEHKGIGPEIESVENTLDKKSSPQTAEISIAKLKSRVPEKVKIVEILQRQMVQNKISAKIPDESGRYEFVPDKIAPGSIAHPKNLEAVSGQKVKILKDNMLFEKKMLKKKGFGLTKVQGENLEKLLVKTKAKKQNTKWPSQAETIKLDAMLSGQVKQNTGNEEPVNPPLNQKIGPNQKMGVNKIIGQNETLKMDSPSFKNQSRETKKMFAPPETTVKPSQKQDPLDSPKHNPENQTGLGKQERFGNGIPEELQTAVQWMAQEEVENKLVEVLSRQARLRGVDLS